MEADKNRKISKLAAEAVTSLISPFPGNGKNKPLRVGKGKRTAGSERVEGGEGEKGDRTMDPD